MPTVDRDGATLYYETDGETGADVPTVAFLNDVGAGAWLWSVQQPALAGPRETIVWDYRGTGRSDAPEGQYDVATLAADLEAVLAERGVADVHLVGVGLGGAVALAYAHRYARVESLALLGTAADGDAVTDRLDALRADPADPAALRASLDAAVAADLDAHADLVERILAWRREDDAGLDAWDAQANAWRAFDAPPLYEVTDPALVLHGTEDAVVPGDDPRAGRGLAEDLPRGTFEAVEGGHWAHLDAAAAVSDRLDEWIAAPTE